MTLISSGVHGEEGFSLTSDVTVEPKVVLSKAHRLHGCSCGTPLTESVSK